MSPSKETSAQENVTHCDLSQFPVSSTRSFDWRISFVEIGKKQSRGVSEWPWILEKGEGFLVGKCTIRLAFLTQKTPQFQLWLKGKYYCRYTHFFTENPWLWEKGSFPIHVFLKRGWLRLAIFFGGGCFCWAIGLDELFEIPWPTHIDHWLKQWFNEIVSEVCEDWLITASTSMCVWLVPKV